MNIPIEQQVSQLQGYVQSLQRTLEYQTSIMVGVHSEIGALRKDNADLREISLRQRRTIAHLQTEVITLKERLQTLTDEKAQYIHEAQIWQAKYRFVETENNTLREQIHRMSEAPRQ